MASEIKFLGHVVSFNSIKPDEDKIAAIKNFKLPEIMVKLRRFMELCGFYREFLISYSSIDKLLYKFTKDVYINPLKKARKRKKLFVHLINFGLAVFQYQFDKINFVIGFFL